MKISFENLPNNIRILFDIFDCFNYELSLVGGCVRDLLMSNTPHDYDFTTNATPEQMKKICEEASKVYDCEIIPTGEKYGTMTFKFGNELYEITTYRSDGTYGDGRRPDNVTFGTYIKDDLSRRDFTINAMAWNPKDGLIDLFEGKRDLLLKKIRTVGNPIDRFTEDSLRILRALRFACRFNFRIDNDTYKAMNKLYSLIDNVSKERIGSELMQIWSCQYIDDSKFITVLENIISHLFVTSIYSWDKTADLTRGINFMSRAYYDLRRCLYFENYKLTHNCREFLNSFAFGNDFIDSLEHIYFAEELLKKESGFMLKAILEKCKLVSERDAIFESLKFTSEDQRYILLKAIDDDDPILISDLAISGSDIIDLGYSGKAVGDILKKVQEYVWEFPDSNNKEALINFVNKLNLEIV